MAAPKDQDHADEPEPPTFENRDELLRKKDKRVLELDKNYGASDLDADGDIADETPGHRN